LLRTSLELKDFVAISFSLPLLAVGSKGKFGVQGFALKWTVDSDLGFMPYGLKWTVYSEQWTVRF
jgi:hypothetical protein